MWKLKFISKENFYKHIQDTIEKYGEKLESYDLKKFNKNIINFNIMSNRQIFTLFWAL